MAIPRFTQGAESPLDPAEAPPPFNCATCEDAGWFLVTWGGKDHREPCDCPAGDEWGKDREPPDLDGDVLFPFADNH